MATYIKLATGLVQLDSPITQESIANALGYTPSNFSGDYNDLSNKPIDGDVLTSTQSNFYIVDDKDNIIALVDSSGIHSVDVNISGISVKGKISSLESEIEDNENQLSQHKTNTSIHITQEERERWNQNQLESNDSDLYITDDQGNILALFNIDGLTVTEIKTKLVNGVKIEDLATNTYVDNQIETVEGKIEEVGNSIRPIKTDVNQLKTDVSEIQSKTDNIEASSSDSSFVIVDDKSNTIAQFDADGLTVTSIKTNNVSTSTINNQLVEDFASKNYVDTEIAALVDGAPETLNTLKELGQALSDHEDEYDALLQVVGNKADKEAVDAINNKIDNLSFDDISGDELTVDVVNTNIITSDSDRLIIQDPQGNMIYSLGEEGLVAAKVTTKELYVESGLSIPDDKVTLSVELKTNYNIGSITDASGTNPVTIGIAGDSLRMVLEKLFVMKADIPTVTLPSLSLTLSNDSANIEYGKEVTFFATITADSGQFHSSFYTGGSTTSTGVTWSNLNLESTNSTFDNKTTGITNGLKFKFKPSSTYYAVANGGTIKGIATAPSGYTSDGTTAINNLGQETNIAISSDTTRQESTEASTDVSAGYIPYSYVLATELPATLPTDKRTPYKPSSITVSGGSDSTYLYIFVPSTNSDITSMSASGFAVPFSKVETSKSYEVNNDQSTTYKVFKTDSTVKADTFIIS